MGQQLDLFTGRVAPPAVPPPPEPPPPEPPPPVPEVLPGQMALFGFRAAALAEARAAVAAGRLEEACDALDRLRERLPDDAAVESELSETKALRERLARIDSPRTRKRAAALVALARDLEGTAEPRASLRRLLLRRAAAEVGKQHGDAGELEGRLVGEYLLDAGELDQAEASLRAAAAITRGARPLFRLADIASMRGEAVAARRLYRGALLTDPWDAALADAHDEEVRALVLVARDELEIEEQPEAWTAPAGIITGVLPRPRTEDDAALVLREDMAPARREALGRARDFVAAIVLAGEARGDAAVGVRRRMKALSAPLFKAYMDRVVRARHG